MTDGLAPVPSFAHVYDVNSSPPNVLTDSTLKYVYGLDLAYAVDGSGNVQVDHADGLGSVRAITDANGNVTQTYQTDEFGVPTQTQGSSGQPFQYTGQQSDPETSLYFLRARMYDPTTGWFLSRDRLIGSLGSPLSLNRYTYAQNNPVVLTDPSGLDIAGEYAHYLIETQFIKNHQNFSREVVHKDPNAPPNNKLLGSIRLDLEDRSTGEFYEIKPMTQRSAGAKQILRYVGFSQTKMTYRLRPGQPIQPMLLDPSITKIPGCGCWPSTIPGVSEA